jgi:hypothetical protein
MISVKKQIVVETSQHRAFRTFTDGIDRWWPREHHIGTSPLERAELYALSELILRVETRRTGAHRARDPTGRRRASRSTGRRAQRTAPRPSCSAPE